jgi:hypothetical protein
MGLKRWKRAVIHLEEAFDSPEPDADPELSESVQALEDFEDEKQE